MNAHIALRTASLLSIVLMTLHLADDMVRGFDTPGPASLIGIAILVVWLFGATLLAHRLSGAVILLLGALFASAMPVIHLRGSGIDEVAASRGGLFFLWTLLALGVTGTFSFLLAAQELWRRRGGGPRKTARKESLPPTSPGMAPDLGGSDLEVHDREGV